MVILDPKEGVRFGAVTKLEDMYREIGCSCIDITRRKVGGKVFDFIVDDEGLLKEDPLVSAIYFEDGNIRPSLVGTLIICSRNSKGETVDISLEDHELLIRRIGEIGTKNKETGEERKLYAIRLDDEWW